MPYSGGYKAPTKSYGVTKDVPAKVEARKKALLKKAGGK